ncbi:sulfite exporter TauE/SafE family protein [Methylobacterium sp. NEAU 140]|uniref:sulfite exporter TauE/SafE family protein n=1 Tax=Methylobacterium sp. NEAU 140 TaxID=3064945 RepID=UPI002735591F|nr:sulfite exporter TauE/SafE family protein [Methylobacterium sp. NEAU 140]MDP4024389.1 sulfite exporter TauE/SafE family protein [Methylobacterium sp. NEAU 140]
MHILSDPVIVAAVLAAFLLAGFVKGVIGLGLPTVAMGLLGTAMPPVQAAALLIVPSLVTNLWQLLAGPSIRAVARRLWPMLAGVIAGTLAGSGLMTGRAGHWAALGLGIALIAYAVIGLAAVRFRVPPRREPWLAPVIGAATGLVTAATGVFVLPAVPYLAALGLKKDDLIQALGLSFTVSTLALAGALATASSLQPGEVGASLLALVPALVGMAAGGWLRGRVSEAVFRRCFFAGLLVLGAHIAIRAVL